MLDTFTMKVCLVVLPTVNEGCYFADFKKGGNTRTMGLPCSEDGSNADIKAIKKQSISMEC